jgi:putative oxidoreductase
MWLIRKSPIAPMVLSVMRMVVGFMFLSVGTMKMFGFPSRGGAVVGFDPFTQIGLAAILEVFGGTLVLLGLATRPAAFIMSGEMAVAYFQVYAPKAFFPVINGGVLAALFCWIFLYLAFAGAGPWSLDALIADAGARRDVGAAPAAGIRA